MSLSEYDSRVASTFTTSDVFNAIAEAGRREILDVLITAEKAVGAIVGDLSMSQPQVSNTCGCSAKWDSSGARRMALSAVRRGTGP